MKLKGGLDGIMSVSFKGQEVGIYLPEDSWHQCLIWEKEANNLHKDKTLYNTGTNRKKQGLNDILEANLGLKQYIYVHTVCG